MARLNCKMCKVKNKQWETENFFVVQCNKHFVPLIILKEHRNEISIEEKNEVLNLKKELFPKLYLDNTISDSNDHWHIHLCKKNKRVVL